MKLSIKAGATSQSVNVFIQDSSSTTGAGLSGLVFSGVTGYYSFSGTAAGSVAITMATLSAVNSAYSSGGFKEIDATNMKGVYRFDIPNAAIASGNGRSVVIYMTATGAAPCVLEIELTGWDNQDAVHGGMSALPNTACTSNASLITSGNSTDQLTVSGGIASSDAKKINAVSTSSVTAVNANVGTAQPVNFTGTAGSALVQTDVTDWKAATAPAMTGDAFARLGAPAGASTAADIAALKTDLDAGVNVAQINGSATAAVALNNSTNSMCYGTCSGGTTTTAVVSTLNNPSSLTSSGQLIGRTIIFLGSTGTGGLQAQASNITASTTGATPTITFTAVTNAPAAADKFIVV